MMEQDVHESQQISRECVPSLDAILGQQFNVLDDGFVRIVDYLGGDAAIVQAARVSYGKGTKHVQTDRGLIRYLLRHRHTTPFEMCEIKLHVRVPMDTWRQWIRHRTANVNEYSTRYSVAIDSAQSTPPDQWRLQAAENRQGSRGLLDPEHGTVLTNREQQLHEMSRSIYEERLAAGIAREQARKDLPLSTYTEAYWKIDLHNLLHFLSLRMDPHAQQEIRDYATTIGEHIVANWVPLTWEAFLDYRVNTLSFSGPELTVLRAFLTAGASAATNVAAQLGWIDRSNISKRHRERDEFVEKLTAIGITLQWSPST